MGAGRKRRNNEGSSHEEFDNEQHLSIEHFQAVKDPFRAAPHTKIATPAPLERGPASMGFRDLVDTMDERIREVLKAHDIAPLRISAFHLRTKNVDNGKDTLIILTESEFTSLYGWRNAASAIYGLLSNGELFQLFRVEIRNPEKMYQDTSTIVKADTDDYHALVAVGPAVEAAVKKLCTGCVAISFHMRGRREQVENRKPTVMVKIAPGTRSNWIHIEEQISEVIDSVKLLPVEVFLEILPAPPSTEVILEQEGHKWRDTTSLPRNPINGSSIGPKAFTRSAGSLGLFIKFQPRGSEKVLPCILTCYHVVRPGALRKHPDGSIDSTLAQQYDRKGIGLSEPFQPQDAIFIKYPSTLDYAATKTSLNLFKARNGDLNQDRKDLALRLEENKSKNYARVICASGKNICANMDQKRNSDWAIAELSDPDQLQSNKPPVLEDQAMINQIPSDQAYDVLPNDVVDVIGGRINLQENDLVIKAGRTSGTTMAFVNKIDSIIPQDGDATGIHETEVISVFSGLDFAQGGDSGAMVTNLQKHWVGMVTKGNGHHDESYIMLADKIFQDVETKSGGRVWLA